MDLLTGLQNLRSTRQFDTERPVPEPVLRTILETGRLAPSAQNRQPWRFLLLSSRPWLDRVQAAIAQSWFLTAPHVLVVKGSAQEAWARDSDNHCYLETDLAIAMDRLTLAAWSQGVGSCWVTSFEPDLLRRNLGLGQEEQVFAVAPLGYPAAIDPAFWPERDRKPFDQVALLL